MSEAADPAPASVLVRFPNWIGDAIMALPVLEQLRRLWPGARLGAQAHPRVAALLEGHPALSQLHPVPARGGASWAEALQSLRAPRYALGLLLTPSFSSALQFFLGGVRERVGWRGQMRDALLTRALPRPPRTEKLGTQYQEMLRPLGWRGSVVPARLEPAAADSALADAWLAEHGLTGARPVALAPGSSYGPAKRWPAASFRDVARRLSSEAGLPVIVLGSGFEAPLLEEVRGGTPGVHALPGQLNLRASAALIARCRALVGNDSGAVHLARAVGTPVVGIFGSSAPGWSGPEPDEGETLYLGLSCSPCFQRECPLPTNRLACLTGITVEAVLGAVQRVTRGGG